MKSFKEYRRDALRYRALESTVGKPGNITAPWADVLGPHQQLKTLADALVGIVTQRGPHGEPGVRLEDAPTMSIGVGAPGLAGLDKNPPVSKLAQRRWVGKNGIVRRKAKKADPIAYGIVSGEGH